MSGTGEADVGSFKEVLYATSVKGYDAAGPALLNEAATSTNPTLIPNKADEDTGIAWTAADALSIVAGGVQAWKLTEASSAILQLHQTNAGLTADDGSSQGDGVITSTYNVYDTVGTAGDAATLPATFQVGTIVVVKNGAAANSMDVFPASGDDLGAGANTAVAIAAGNFKVFIGTTANATWEQLMGGTA